MRLLIAGGGTGGHLFPALAIARAMRVEDPDGSILFVGTQHGIEARIIPATEFPIRYITVRGMRGTGFVNKLRGAVEIPKGILQSYKILKEFRPHVVLGVGGYASGPTVAAALLRRTPTAIQEQNSVMGTTNRLLSRFVDRIFTSWDHTEPAPPESKMLVAGNPVRSRVLESAVQPRDDDKFHLLIFGGSQGARSINQAIAANLDQFAPIAHRIAVLHQTGRESVEAIRGKYEMAGVEADVREFIDEMGEAYQWADLVVCRAGAGSLAEITALGKAAIVVPFPYAIGDHQARNAAVLESRGAVKVIREENLKNGALAKQILQAVDEPSMIEEMARNSRECGRPDAARVIALDLLKTGENRA